MPLVVLACESLHVCIWCSEHARFCVWYLKLLQRKVHRGYCAYLLVLAGGDVLTITGTKFGTTIPTVTVGGEALTVVSNSDTEVVVMFPPLQPGSFPLDLVVQDVGLALA